MQALEQKESLGEYGSGWGWDSAMTHAFDQVDIFGYPRRMANDINRFGLNTSGCRDDMEKTNGALLFSKSMMYDQLSCKANTANAGNYYLWVSAVINIVDSHGKTTNSICSKNWTIPTNDEDDDSFFRLINYYGSPTSFLSNDVIYQPLSLVYGGIYDRSAIIREHEKNGEYWTSERQSNTVLAYSLHLGLDTMVSVHNQTSGSVFGYSLRCVAGFILPLYIQTSERARSFRNYL